MKHRYDILTDVYGKPGRFWGDHTTYVGPSVPPSWLLRLVGRSWADNLVGVIAALRMFLRRSRCQGVVTDGGASGQLFAWLQALCPWGRKPHVMIDTFWFLSANPLRAWFKKLRVRLAARSVHRIVVWASHEVKDYADAFSLRPGQVEYIPFHTTLHDYQFEIRDDGYLFAGGNSERDYRTLIEAVRPLSLPVWIATTNQEQFAGLHIPPHVRLKGTTADGFRQAMAAARLIVVPMQNGLLHSGGQQTCLNAMALGKPTIAVGRKWAVDCITHGENGLIVDYEDPRALRRAIEWVFGNPDEAQAMAERGRQHAQWFTTHRCMTAIYDLVKQAPGARSVPERPAPLYRHQEITADVRVSGNTV